MKSKNEEGNSQVDENGDPRAAKLDDPPAAAACELRPVQRHEWNLSTCRRSAVGATCTKPYLRSTLLPSACELGLAGSLRVEWSPGLQFGEEPFELLRKGVQTKPIAWARTDGCVDGSLVGWMHSVLIHLGCSPNRLTLDLSHDVSPSWNSTAI